MTRRSALWLLLLFTSPLAAAEKPGLKAGAFAQDVTPPSFPISVNGGMADRQATKANDPLHARCLVLDDGTTKLAIVVVDSCMLPRDLVDQAKKLASEKTGIPVDNMLISATHTHTAPTSTGVFQSDPDEGYVKFLPGKIAEGIAKAHAARVPAEAGWGVADEPNQLFNRRWHMKPGTLLPDPFGGTDKVKMNPGNQNPALVEPAGPIDPQVSILSVRTADTHQPIALLANYSLHYVGDMPALSADYFGVFADRIAQKLGAGMGFVGILSNGTSGDVNNVDFRNPRPKTMPGERSRLVADAVADAAAKAYQSAKHDSNLSLAAAVKDLTLKVRKPTADDVAKAKLMLAAADGRALKGQPEIYARESVLLAEYPDTVPVRIQALRVGNLGIAAIPCETFTEIGLEIKEKSPLKPTFTISLANGYNGYLPTPRHHALGGYETWRARSSYLEVGASDAIVPTALDLLKTVATSK